MDGAPQKSGKDANGPGSRRGSIARLAADAVAGLMMQVVARVRPNLAEFLAERQLLIWGLAVVIGTAVAYVAIGFRLAIGIVQLPWLGTTSERVASAAAELDWYVVILAPAIGGLIVGLVLARMVPGHRAHGVADVIEARALHNSRIDPRTGFVSAVLSILSIGSGASVGREGPVVHLGATIAAVVEDRFALSPGARRTLLACGVASAISASFNAPIAGVLFAHEVILAHYAFRALVPIVIASVLGGVITRYHFDDAPAFHIPDYQISSAWEFPAFALLGLTCAAVSIAFQLALMGTERVAWKVPLPLWLRPCVGGLLIGAIAVFYPQVLGVGYETTDDALQRELPLVLALSLIVAKTAATAIALASRFAGGIFSPTLYLGAMTGSAFGLMAASTFPELGSSQGLYAILGMGAVAAAVLGAPLSTTLIVFELTGGYQMTIALLLTVSIAVGVSQAFLGHSLFYWQLGRRGLFLQDGPHKAILRRIKVADVMEPVGADPGGDYSAGPPKVWLLPSDTLEQALRAFDRSGQTRIVVVAEAGANEVVGHAERLAALDAYNKALIEAAEEEHK
ncbi:MAG: chloride channel protein [Hyphomicrobiaceae bacterium]|nr:chloride channel protein [Hyphomicrobiaceae bacterium]